MSFLAALRTRAAQQGRDGGAATLYLRQLLRGNHAEREVANVDGVRPPVLLIHGYFATRGSLYLFERRLAARGYVVVSFGLGTLNLRDIRDSAGLIARKVESIVDQTGVERIDVVGHSMGGLVGLHYLKRLGGRRRVRRLVLLGTPTQGTWSAVLGLAALPFGLGSIQLLPGSSFLGELEACPLPPFAEVISITGKRDRVAPQSKTLLAGVRHVVLPTSHAGLLVDDSVVSVVDAILRA